jgi:hypothetical protein
VWLALARGFYVSAIYGSLCVYAHVLTVNEGGVLKMLKDLLMVVAYLGVAIYVITKACRDFYKQEKRKEMEG